MTSMFKAAWDGVVTPLLRRPPMVQVAALCWRKAKDGGEREVLLVTSRETKRWIIPKGWPVDGMDLAQAAALEAWEEGGVRPAKVFQKSVGQYRYTKTLDSGAQALVDTVVIPIEVSKTLHDYPEAGERTRKWVPLSRAAEMVGEEELKEILRAF